MEDHSNNNKRKPKGGVEKNREKKQKKLQKKADSCFKIKDIFQKSVTTINALNKNSNEDLPKFIELDKDQNNLKTNETHFLNTLNKMDVTVVKNIKSIKVDSQSLDVNNKVVSDEVMTLENRFSKHKEMYVDFEWLHSTNFKLISNLPENAMNKIAELLTDFSPNIDKKILQDQLIDFAGKWDSLSTTLLYEYNCMTLDLEKDEEDEESELVKEHRVH